VAVLVLDDVVGLISPDDAERFGMPYLKRIFDAFPDLIRVFHNDTPNKAVFPGLARIGFDVFNFSHEIDMEEARDLMGPEVVFMGNLPPLDLLVRGTPDEVGDATRTLVRRMDQVGPMLLSPGGGVSPGTPVEVRERVEDPLKIRHTEALRIIGADEAHHVVEHEHGHGIVAESTRTPAPGIGMSGIMVNGD
jgi:uroporphyrinogen-III decarboxylase